MSANAEPPSLSGKPSTEQVAEQDNTEAGPSSAAEPAAEVDAPRESASPPVATAANGSKAAERLPVPEIPSGFAADIKLPGSVCDPHTLPHKSLSFRSSYTNRVSEMQRSSPASSGRRSSKSTNCFTAIRYEKMYKILCGLDFLVCQTII